MNKIGTVVSIFFFLITTSFEYPTKETRLINGKVFTESKEKIIGITVFEYKNTENQTITNISTRTYFLVNFFLKYRTEE